MKLIPVLGVLALIIVGVVLVARIISGAISLISGLLQLVLGIAVIVALVAIVIWMFKYASKKK